MKKMIFGTMLLPIFFSLHGMNQNAINYIYYGNKRVPFGELTKDQRATLMLMIYENPIRAVKNLNDLKKNNVLHFILSSHGKLTNDFVIEVFRLCWSHGAYKLLDRQNSSKQSPRDLIGALDESLNAFYEKGLNGEEEKPISWPAENLNLLEEES